MWRRFTILFVVVVLVLLVSPSAASSVRRLLGGEKEGAPALLEAKAAAGKPSALLPKGRPVIFDFPKGYFGYGAKGKRFHKLNPYNHPQNPMNLNPYFPEKPLWGEMKQDEPPIQWKAPGKNQFGKLEV